MLRESSREVAAEFLGTFVLMTFGLAVNAQSVLSSSSAGEFLSVNFGWGMGVALGIYVAGGVSGAHLNPAVTLALAVFGRFSWSKVIPFVVAQCVAAFVASALIYATYFDALNAFDGGTRAVTGENATAGIWATYPREFLTNVPGGLLDQTVATALLLMLVFALSDQKNLAPQANLAPLLVGGVVFAIGMTFGYNCGYAINPARDFGPRLFTAMAGWGMDVFRTADGFWWIPIVGPCLGGVVGAAIYELFVGRHHSN